MRDALLNFGKLQPATKATRVYSANQLDLGVVKQNLGDVKNLYVCFQLGEDVASGDTFLFELYDSADNSTYALISSNGTAITSGKAGDIIKVPVPKSVRRYLKAGCYPNSSGTLDAQDIECWLEFC